MFRRRGVLSWSELTTLSNTALPTAAAWTSVSGVLSAAAEEEAMPLGRQEAAGPTSEFARVKTSFDLHL